MQNRAQLKKFAGLEVICIENDPKAKSIVLLHGFGADFHDLVPLAQELKTGNKVFNWIFPNGPLEVPLGGHFDGRAWFPISIAALEGAMQRGEHFDLSETVPAGIQQSRDKILSLVQQLQIAPENLIIGGFSQGAMLAVEATMHMAKSPAALVLLSGTLVNASSWRGLAKKHKGLKFFQSHGTFDPVLSLNGGQALEKLLVENEWDGHLLTFPGQHEIPLQVLNQAGSFLRNI